MVKYILTIALTLTLSAATAQVQMMFTQDSLSQITSPLDLDSLFYWFAADVAVYDSLGGAIANNEGVGTWTDLSGNGYDVTMDTNTYRPVWKATGGPGSKPCIQFDGTNDYLRSVAHWWGSDDLTIFVVMKFANATRDAGELFLTKLNTGTNKRQFFFQGQNTSGSYELRAFLFKDGATSNYTWHQDGAKSALWKLLEYVNNSGMSMWIDGATESLTKNTIGSGDDTILNDNSTSLGIGAFNVNATPANFFQGSISEIIVFSRALTTAQRTAIENYLNKKYDLY